MNVLDLFRKRRVERREDVATAYWRLIEEEARAECARRNRPPKAKKPGDRDQASEDAVSETRLAEAASSLDELASVLGLSDDDVARHLLQSVELFDLAKGDPERQLEELKAKQRAAYAAVEAENAAWAAEVERRERLGRELHNEVGRLTGEFPECNRRIARLAELRQLLTQQGATAALTAGGAL